MCSFSHIRNPPLLHAHLLIDQLTRALLKMYENMHVNAKIPRKKTRETKKKNHQKKKPPKKTDGGFINIRNNKDWNTQEKICESGIHFRLCVYHCF